MLKSELKISVFCLFKESCPSNFLCVELYYPQIAKSPIKMELFASEMDQS
jgi:hypothetical protein